LASQSSKFSKKLILGGKNVFISGFERDGKPRIAVNIDGNALFLREDEAIELARYLDEAVVYMLRAQYKARRGQKYRQNNKPTRMSGELRELISDSENLDGGKPRSKNKGEVRNN